MKRALLTMITLFLLFSVEAILFQNNLAKANIAHHDPISPDVPYGPPSPFPDPPELIIQSPQHNASYSNNEVLLNFTVVNPYTKSESTRITEISYNFNGLAKTLWSSINAPLSSTQQFLTRLNASTGQHSLQLSVKAEFLFYSDPRYIFSPSIFPIEVQETILFRIDTTAFSQPSISIASPENKTYEKSNIPLNFALNESSSQISYSLDGQENVSTIGNTTLTGLSNGEHNITIYATNDAGNVETSETIIFSIVNEAKSFPVAIAVVLLALATVVIPSLAIYFKKRKH
ncbi:MAG: hypothetical protein NWE80_02215 [Candidatus Bathyarchaeota archaeon]|nr:hypothetical protein [Candidatus Bathyarchaeota archaeon]